MHTSILPLLKNPSFWSPFFAWLVAQSTKILCNLQKTHRFDFRYLVSTGGMPSAHSAMACGLATSVGLNSGFDTPVFAIGLGFALVIMFDASTVRRAAGQQAKLLNQIVDDLLKTHRLPEQKLAELLGHTRLEVILGAIIGILIALLVNAVHILHECL